MFTEIKRYVTFAFYRISIYIYKIEAYIFSSDLREMKT